MFKKWHSIENSYQQKNIDWWLNAYPELKDEQFVVTEKLHGSNFQWYIQPNQPIKAGSRSHFLNLDGSFQGVTLVELINAEKDILEHFQNIADTQGVTFRLFSELIGQGIQKGVDYGTEKRLFYFGLMVDDELLPFADFQLYLDKFADCIVPVVTIVNSLELALAVNPEFNSLVLGINENVSEGVVIMPYDQVYTSPQGSVFMLKNKNATFKEKASSPKPQVVDSEVLRLKLEFIDYVTDARLQSVFSKHGPINSKQEIGKYLRLLIADAREDFEKDFDISELDKIGEKQVFNVGSLGFELIKKYL